METVDKTLLKAFPTTFSHESDECGLLLFTHQYVSFIPPYIHIIIMNIYYYIYIMYICMRGGGIAGWMIILGKVKRREIDFSLRSS